MNARIKKNTEQLALLGGSKAISSDLGELLHWPLVTKEDEDAVLDVLRHGSMSDTGITKLFEKEWAEWMGVKYALAYCSGTSSLHAAMWACGVGAGDEVICPSTTYWASCTAALSLGAAVNFADIDPKTLCISPDDIEHRICSRTKAIIVVHYAGHPCDMDRIVPIAKKHGVKIIEDVSHAHGSLYKGRMCGTLGDIAGMSMMSCKGFAIGEAGMLTTNDRTLYERCIAYGHYERTGIPTNWTQADSEITQEELIPYVGIAMGGFKHRINQTCSAMGRVQLKYYPQRMAEIQRAMERFWSLLADMPGLTPHKTTEPGSTMGPWYYPLAHYKAEELGGLPIEKFVEALTAEGLNIRIGCNAPLHLHNLFHTADLFHMGSPTMISFGQRDVRQGEGSLPVAENIRKSIVTVPWIKHDRQASIEEIAGAFLKVARNYKKILI